jgi:hypothetical protein
VKFIACKLISVAVASVFPALLVCAQPSVSTAQPPTITLYSINKHRGERRESGLNFENANGSGSPADLRYGSLYVGDELDWFESSAAKGNRSVIKDLGPRKWSDEFDIPVVQPLAKLKPGEQRRITIDASGANGANGRNGAPGSRLDKSSEIVIPAPSRTPDELPPIPEAAPETGKRKPKVDPMFVRAVIGHMYVIHVVDEARDFYALFRVEALQRGDNCTISWRLIPTPVTNSVKNAK